MTQTLTPPQNLEELKQAIQNLDGSELLRTELDQRRYELYCKTKLAKTFKARIKYQLNKSDTGYYQTLNEFRYSYLLQDLPDVKQIVVWFRDQETMQANLEMFKNQGIVLINEIKNQSIKEIIHLHLLKK